MKYCLFCRDSFEDEMTTCPYCGDELSDELPEEDEDREDREDREGENGEGPAVGPGGGALVQVGIFVGEEHLRAAVAVLEQAGIYFEIEETDRRGAQAGIIPSRAWRILVEDDAGHDAFVRLVSAVPEAFPEAVAEASGIEPEADEEPCEDLAAIDRLLAAADSPSGAKELAWGVIELFSSGEPADVVRAKAVLARRGAVYGRLLADIAAGAAALGGEGAERVLFHSMQVLEAIGYDDALAGLEALYDSPVVQVRIRAAYAAGRLGAPAAVARLIDLMADEDEDVRYEASESVWRLTGLDFEFEPYAPVEEERENIERLREIWEGARRTGRVRGRVTLGALLRGLGGGP